MTEDIGSDTNLTRNQQLIWTEQLLYPDLPLYNMAFAFHIAGPIDLGHFRRAFQAFVDGTDAFRTVINEQDGVPQQHVLEEFSYEVALVDLTNESNANAALEIWLRERSARCFNLATCLFDSVLLKVGREHTVWYLNQHHLITDGWSTSLVYRRVTEAYSQVVEGNLESVSHPSFKDYVSEETTYRSSWKCEKAKCYWNDKLRKTIDPIYFYGRTAPMQKISRFVRIHRALSSERSAKLRARAAQPNIAALTPHLTMFHIFGAILLAYLHRISGNQELSIGTPIHNRSSKVMLDTVGLLMDVAPLYVNIEAGATFVSLIRQLRDESFSALRYSRYAPGNPIRNRAYEAMLNYQNSSYTDFCGMPMRLEWLQPGWATGSVNVQVHQFGSSEDYEIEFDFNEEIFDLWQRERAIDHFFRILDGFIEDEEQAIEDVDMFEPGERALITEIFNHTDTSKPEAQTVIEQFEAQVEQTPDAIAVVFEDQHLTYRELNRRANQLAHFLRKHRVGPDVLVGICMESSLEMVVGILGILKAGGAYMPLDPEYPKKRLAFMLEDAQPPVLLTQERVVERLPKHGAQVVCLDKDWVAISLESNESPVSGVTTDNLAYVIYTSGSTGMPKGVMICHCSICNRLIWGKSAYKMNEADRIIQKTSFSFDVSVRELFEPLMVGAQLILARSDRQQDIAYIVRLISEQRITAVSLPPSMLQVFLDEQGVEKCNCLRRVNAGGEVLHVELQERFFACLTADLYIGYGPTEATVGVTYWICKRGSNQCTVPIGRPIVNTQIYILDCHLQPVPIGVPGELHIGGIGLARGYLNRPDLTAEKFIPNPFSNKPGSRLYKTGDLARYLTDGNIEFLGRLDNQVKIRGFRIELGEIGVALSQHPAVRETVVLAREDIPGNKRLVVYVVPGQKQAPTFNELRGFLQQKLPEYMVPSSFVFLDTLPLTPNGKVDRRALPAPDRTRPEPGETFVAPHSPLESLIAEVWKEVLGVDQVSVYDNFFDLGGHSLLSMKVVAHLEKKLGLRINPGELIFQTLGQLASACEERKNLQQPSQ